MICSRRFPVNSPVERLGRLQVGGVIFSDGVENDFLEFNNGSIATIGVAEQQARLVVR